MERAGTRVFLWGEQTEWRATGRGGRVIQEDRGRVRQEDRGRVRQEDRGRVRQEDKGESKTGRQGGEGEEGRGHRGNKLQEKSRRVSHREGGEGVGWNRLRNSGIARGEQQDDREEREEIFWQVEVLEEERRKEVVEVNADSIVIRFELDELDEWKGVGHVKVSTTR
eukprot:598278-Hanusia_phi.AAC.6